MIDIDELKHTPPFRLNKVQKNRVELYHKSRAWDYEWVSLLTPSKFQSKNES